jgi:hypothetical protein
MANDVDEILARLRPTPKVGETLEAGNVDLLAVENACLPSPLPHEAKAKVDDGDDIKRAAAAEALNGVENFMTLDSGLCIVLPTCQEKTRSPQSTYVRNDVTISLSRNMITAF